MIVKPAIIPNIFVEYIFCSPEEIGEFVIIAGKLSTDERNRLKIPLLNVVVHLLNNQFFIY
jgi:hypothetical protein